jgi:spore coat protein U-like protein
MTLKGINQAVAAVGVAGLLAGTPAVAVVSAASATADLSVSATVTNNCTVTTAALAFGSYDPVVANASAGLDGTGRLTVACTKGVAPTIALAAGSNASGATRRLSDGAGHFLEYNLFQDSSRSTAWSASGAGIYTATAATSKASRDFTVYGRVAGNQDVPAGAYGDTVVATVNF